MMMISFDDGPYKLWDITRYNPYVTLGPDFVGRTGAGEQVSVSKRAM